MPQSCANHPQLFRFGPLDCSKSDKDPRASNQYYIECSILEQPGVFKEELNCKYVFLIHKLAYLKPFNSHDGFSAKLGSISAIFANFRRKYF
jgi:hypothetical protein